MTGTMPNTSKAMEPEQLRELMQANGVDSADKLAELLGVHRTTVFRWLAGSRRIDRAAAALINSVLKKKPKK
jgi:DNA-binding transcriptional regulator YiaG